MELKKYLNVYQFTTVLPGCGKEVKFRPITTYQMKELLSFDGDEEDGLDNLINSCVITEDFKVEDIPLQDRFFLLIEVRKKSKGSTNEITYDCDNCKSQVIDKLDLGKLKVKKLKKLDYVVKLDDNISVEVELLTRNHQKIVKGIVAKEIKNGNVKEKDKVLEENILTYISGIKKIITPEEQVENPLLEDKTILFKEGPSFFYDNLVKWYDDLEFGVDFNFDIKCPHCGAERKIEVPVENFFN
jgi:hypothetical protein